MGVLEAGIGEPEVIEPVIERRPRDRDADVAHVGEVRQSGSAGLVDLPEDDLLPHGWRAMRGFAAPGSAGSQPRVRDGV